MATLLYAENYLPFVRQSRAFRLKKYDFIMTGSNNFDASGSTGTFKFPSGNVTLVASSTQNVDFSNSSGTFLTTTGAVTIGSGAVTLSGSTTVSTGKTFNTTDAAALQEGGVIIPRYEFVSYAQGGQSSTQYTNTNGNVSLYVNDNTSGTYKVIAASASFATAGGASCAVTVEVCTGTQAPGSGTAQLTGALSLTGTANTAVNGTIIGSPTTIAAGNRVGLVFSGTNTGLVNCVVNVVLQRLS